MAKFLNRIQLSESIQTLIKEADKELVLVVPYIKTSDTIFKLLQEANKRGVETTIVYRENELEANEKNKLLSLDNLNLFHQPNLHAKCYYNGKHLIIGSMNLYEHSFKNNREMGVLFINPHYQLGFGDADDAQIFDDAIIEIQGIINSSQIEKKSRETIEQGFEMDIIKSEEDKLQDYCQHLNKMFIHKRFTLYKDERGQLVARCQNYYDKIDVIMEGRVRIVLNYPKYKLKEMHERFMQHYDEFMFQGFKFYWNTGKNDWIYFYTNSRHSMWNNANEAYEIEMLQKRIAEFIERLKPMLKVV